MILRSLLAPLPLIFVTAEFCAKAGVQKKTHLKNQGVQREAFIYIPPVVDGDQAFPLWLALPGGDHTTEEFLRESGLDIFARNHRLALLVTAGSQPDGFNLGAGCKVNDQGPNEVEYIRTLLYMFLDETCIDNKRVFCTGFGSGGRMCIRLASDLSLVFAAVAPVAGLQFPIGNNAQRPIPVLSLHGSNDLKAPWKGSGWQGSVLDAAVQWAKFNGCKDSKVETLPPNNLLFRLTDCADDAVSVQLLEIEGGGHFWPQGAVSGNALILQFFESIRPTTLTSIAWSQGTVSLGELERALPRSTLTTSTFTTATSTTKTMTGTTTTVTSTTITSVTTTEAAILLKAGMASALTRHQDSRSEVYEPTRSWPDRREEQAEDTARVILDLVGKAVGALLVLGCVAWTGVLCMKSLKEDTLLPRLDISNYGRLNSVGDTTELQPFARRNSSPRILLSQRST